MFYFKYQLIILLHFSNHLLKCSAQNQQVTGTVSGNTVSIVCDSNNECSDSYNLTCSNTADAINCDITCSDSGSCSNSYINTPYSVYDMTGNISITCSGQYSCNSDAIIYCFPNGENCLISCQGTQACKSASINTPNMAYTSSSSMSLICNRDRGCEGSNDGTSVIYCNQGADCYITCSAQYSCRYRNINHLGGLITKPTGNFVIECTGLESCKDTNIDCLQTGNCNITCSDQWSCQGSEIICPDNKDCLIDCSGSRSCQSSVIYCPRTFGKCIIDCQSQYSCRNMELNCYNNHTDKNGEDYCITTSCSGVDACNGVVKNWADSSNFTYYIIDIEDVSISSTSGPEIPDTTYSDDNIVTSSLAPVISTALLKSTQNIQRTQGYTTSQVFEGSETMEETETGPIHTTDSNNGGETSVVTTGNMSQTNGENSVATMTISNPLPIDNDEEGNDTQGLVIALVIVSSLLACMTGLVMSVFCIKRNKIFESNEPGKNGNNNEKIIANLGRMDTNPYTHQKGSKTHVRVPSIAMSTLSDNVEDILASGGMSIQSVSPKNKNYSIDAIAAINAIIDGTNNNNNNNNINNVLTPGSDHNGENDTLEIYSDDRGEGEGVIVVNKNETGYVGKKKLNDRKHEMNENMNIRNDIVYNDHENALKDKENMYEIDNDNIGQKTKKESFNENLKNQSYIENQIIMDDIVSEIAAENDDNYDDNNNHVTAGGPQVV